MTIRFISHACVLITTSDCNILCDPWLMGTAFNDSWRLFPAPEQDKINYDEITHLWISHEHPDHFHVLTLKSMPQHFKDRVILLFQKNNSDKMPKAFDKLGFRNIVLMHNRKIIKLTDKTSVYNQQVGQMDSALAIRDEHHTILNLNDCEANSYDCKLFVRDLGKIDLVLNQFSIAGYGGKIDYPNHLPQLANTILKNMIDNHRDLGVNTTIPFASNIYFCCEDNKHINNYANTPEKVHQFFKDTKLNVEILYPGDSYDLDTKVSVTEQALMKYQTLYKNINDLLYEKGKTVGIDKIREAMQARYLQLKEKYPGILLKKLKPIIIFIPDIDLKVRLSLYDGEFTILDKYSDYDLIINSQPLHFALDNTWGIQTLGVSARWLIKSREDVWNWYRIISSMNNAGFYLKPRFLFSTNNFYFLKERMHGGLNQLLYQLQRMKI